MIDFEQILNLAKWLTRERKAPPFHSSIVGDARAEKRAGGWILVIQLIAGIAFLAFTAFVLWAAAF
jgi:hypothetical protein